MASPRPQLPHADLGAGGASPPFSWISRSPQEQLAHALRRPCLSGAQSLLVATFFFRSSSSSRSSSSMMSSALSVAAALHDVGGGGTGAAGLRGTRGARERSEKVEPAW